MSIPLWDYARFTQRDSSHHQAFWNALDDALTTEQKARIAAGGDLRGIWEAQSAEAAAPPPASDWLVACRKLVGSFEGCRLQAYPDPGTGGDPWTIGWGHTGPDVRPGVVWSKQKADEVFDRDLSEARAEMLRLLPMASRWQPAQQAALTSFVFNVGSGALEGSTLRRRLMGGEDPDKVIPEELPRWNQGGGSVMAGLVSRRAAEVELFRSVVPAVAIPPRRPANPLAVPFFPQQDNGPEGWRQCQTSSIAMCLAFLKVPGIKDDTDYLKVVQRFGDTTSQDAHRKALAQLGVRARFRQNLSATELMGEIKGGLPVAIGVLHHGPASAPSGGGHYLTAIGFTADSWIVHDPYGELDLVHGGWANRAVSAGKDQRYSFRNLNARWLPEGPSSGWGWVFS